jgi:aldehyde dehydrogenase (NAD+)
MNVPVKEKFNSIETVFKQQRKYSLEYAQSDYKTRIRKLDSIYTFLSKKENENLLCEAIYKDFKKPKAEVISSELAVILVAIKGIKRKLRNWMGKEYVPTPLILSGTSSFIQYEAKGVCLIIGPWNYPFQLCISPLLFALAAGNTAIIKPSEYPTYTSAFIKGMIDQLFDPKEVAVFEGDVPVAQSLLALPFDHIYFTGSPSVGKIVMTAAAKHLSSVTLELGGKSPCIIDDTANIKKAAMRTVWGKFLNGGQTCIAPDYIMVHESAYDEYLSSLKENIEKKYNSEGEGIQKSPDFCRIINQKNFKRVKSLIDDAVEKGAKIYYGAKFDEKDNYISPTILTGVNNDMLVMQEEIFGPIIPVLKYENKEEVIKFIRNKPKPLALYIFSGKRKNANYFLKQTTAGGTMINDFHVYYANPNLPFGGVNNSGMGKTHGHFGFKEFSNARAVMKQKWGVVDLLHPPYGKRTLLILRSMIRFG